MSAMLQARWAAHIDQDAFVPLRHGDAVVFFGPGPDPTPESWERHDPTDEPRPADYGTVIAVEQSAATVAWRFGGTSSVPITHLYKRPSNRPIRRYNVLFENVEKIEDATYTVVTGGGAGEAVWLASRNLELEHPNFWPVVVEIEDLGEVLVDYRHSQIPREVHDPLEWM